MRVRELEKKLKTLEISGLWAVQGSFILLVLFSHCMTLAIVREFSALFMLSGPCCRTICHGGISAFQFCYSLDHKGGMIAAADLQKESKENEGACGATDTQDNRSEGDPENDFEDSSWDPYCEIGGDLGMTQSSLIDTLIDVSVCQTNQNNNIGSGLTSSTGSVSLDFNDGTLGALAKARDDFFIDAHYAKRYERAYLLRKTRSCPGLQLSHAHVNH